MTAILHDTKTYVALGPDDTQHECADHPLRVHASGRTHVGRVRKTNEDHFLVGELSRRLTVRATSLEQPATRVSHCRGHVFLVADGMGGHRAGETASALSVLSIESFLLNSLKRFICCEWADDGVMREFRQALEQADARIIDEATSHPEMMGMGTTLTLAFVIERRLYVAHAGDSRCYRFAGGRLEQITKDHTVAAELVAHGLLSAEQAERSPFRNSITNALGGGEKGVRPELHRVDLSPGDTVVVCSDGLHGMVPDNEIAAILGREDDPDTACNELIIEANSRGGKDNITVIVAKFD